MESVEATGKIAAGDRLPALDGLRALAALSVLIYHVCGALNVHRQSYYGALTSRLGNQGVAVFFVLSGFLLSKPFLRAILKEQPLPKIGSFYLRRILRIYPAYWAALSLYIALGLMAVPSWSVAGQLFGLVHVYRKDLVLIGLGVSWTLCVEVAFYAALPLFAVAVSHRAQVGSGPERRRRLVLRSITALILLGVTYRVGMVAWGHSAPQLSWVPAYFDWFGLGMLLGLFGACNDLGMRIPRPLALLAGAPALSWLLAIECVWVVIQFRIPVGFEARSELQVLGSHPIVGLAAFFLVLPTALGVNGASGATRFLVSPVMQFLGRVSYGVFLWHRVWLSQLVRTSTERAWDLEFWPTLAEVLVASLISAALSYWLIERPCITIGRRLGRKPRPASTRLPQEALN